MVTTLTYDPIMLYNVLLISFITKNILSVSKLLTYKNVFVEFVANLCYIKARKT